MKKQPNTGYMVATMLANDLAEDNIASSIADMMIEGSIEKAKKIRKLSESNSNQLNDNVQEYRRVQRTIYSALSALLDGYGGYKIVKQ